MCLITFHFDPTADNILTLAANRDEFYERPTRTAHFWEDNPSIFAGRDLKAGGTWMGVNKSGRFAALTNYRDFRNRKNFDTSRGELVTLFLQGDMTLDSFISLLESEREQYDGYNILFMEAGRLFYYSNKLENVKELVAGTYALSNHLLDTDWPKVKLARKVMESYISSGGENESLLFDMLFDETKAPDSELPDTGVPYEWEKLLSSPFIKSETYGTRLSTILKITKKDFRMNEKTFIPHSSEIKASQYQFEFTY